MKVISFKPWIGEKYRGGGLFKKRVLVLGESYYANPGIVTVETTNDFIRAQIEGKWTKPFFTKVAATFLGHAPRSVEDKGIFWHSVAHYVFIQAIVGGAPRIRPTQEMWDHARKPFLELIQNHLRPECILVFGKGIWNHLPAGDPGPSIAGATTRRFDLGNGLTALACGINHPASKGFSSKTLHPLVLKAIDLA